MLMGLADSFYPVHHLPDINDELVKKTLPVRPVLPDFTGKSSSDLVSLKGVIVAVDEKNAFSWPVCNVCESSNLQTDPSGSFLYCPSCQQGVSEPVIKMKVDAFLNTHLSQHTEAVLVQLHQNTIEKLLPADLIGEGYDLEMVLGVEVGPINCYCDRSSSKREKGDMPSVILTEIFID